ncbi:inhibitor of apoptosis-promoting Bax1-domain-containing protein [Mycotypha africana]|uniref:inhibitor of apoptosis-promoting Bax1-domain-containing protein n=1 Tax=Mycotypha africana TaxID=64632 RepID=UPI00230135A7|nr:inhibitor of apoptosis-promoting Bax1-domain-containing protein [Mycotypha africana]KAI8991300.1 inhibitor of apoptosis-promoting Bax1-domain-containing protein [Mycotypha africana]
MSEKRSYYGYNSSSSSNSNLISRPVRRHLLHVYLTLAAMSAIATMSTQLGDYLGPVGSTIGSLGTVLSILLFRFTAPNSRNRWALLLAYSVSIGIGLASFLTFFTHWDSSGNIVFMALSSAVVIFLGFSASAVLADRRSMLYVGGLVSSILAVLFWLSLANSLFIRSQSILSLEMYGGLIAFAGFVLYDTQMIIERASAGLTDVPGHSMELFMDLYALFVRLLEIFLKKELDKEEDRKRKKRQNRLRRDYY